MVMRVRVVLPFLESLSRSSFVSWTVTPFEFRKRHPRIMRWESSPGKVMLVVVRLPLMTVVEEGDKMNVGWLTEEFETHLPSSSQ